MKTIEITLDLKTYNRLIKIAKLAGVTRDQVISVILALEVLKKK